MDMIVERPPLRLCSERRRAPASQGARHVTPGSEFGFWYADARPRL